MYSTADISLDLLPGFIQGMQDYVHQLEGIRDSAETDDVKLGKLNAIINLQ